MVRGVGVRRVLYPTVGTRGYMALTRTNPTHPAHVSHLHRLQPHRERAPARLFGYTRACPPSSALLAHQPLLAFVSSVVECVRHFPAVPSDIGEIGSALAIYTNTELP